jgi:hypothetical protein
METQIELPPTAKDKAELLERIRREHATLEQTLGRLSEAQMTAPLEGGWSVKDHLAHITAWEHILLVSHIGGQPFHEAVQMDAASAEAASTDDVNDHLHQRDQDHSLAEVLGAFRRSYRQVLEAIERMDEADLFKTRSADSAPLIDYVAGNTYEHYMEHLATIRTLPKKKAGKA